MPPQPYYTGLEKRKAAAAKKLKATKSKALLHAALKPCSVEAIQL